MTRCNSLLAHVSSLLITAFVSAAPITSVLAQVASSEGDAAGCRRIESRTTLAALTGRPIASVGVEPLPPPSLPGPASLLDGLHVLTRERTVRRQLRFAAGDRVDTLAIAESLRRLRRLRYLGDAMVVGTACGDLPNAPVELTVVTRDAWSTKPSVRFRSGGSGSLGITERNVLGMGREATLAIRSDAGRIGIGGALRDPWLLDGPLVLEVGRYGYRDGGEWYAALGKRETSVLDRAGFSAGVFRSTRDAAATGGDAFRRTTASALMSRRLSVADTRVIGLLFGAEYERTGLLAGSRTPLVGPERVRREFVGIDIGLTRRAILYDTLTWMLPGHAIVDVPLVTEAEGVVAIGEERSTGRMAGRLDAWAGRVWMPRRTLLITGDVWASGFRRGTSPWEAATLRASVAGVAPARRGLWSARISAEQMLEPDPDVRVLASDDPLTRAFPDSARLAEAAVSAIVERSVWLHPLGRSWTLGGALFGAGSMRWDPAALAHEALYIGAVGGGIRLVPMKAGRGMARFDIGIPVTRAAGVSQRPFIAISVSPWFDALRHRDGRRER